MSESNTGWLKKKHAIIGGIAVLALVFVIAVGLIAGLHLRVPSKLSYRNEMVLRAKYRNTREKGFAETLNDASKGIHAFSFSFLNETSIFLPRRQLDFVKGKLEEQRIDHYILVEDLQSLIDVVESGIAMRKLEHNSSSFDVANFHRYEEITKYLHDLAAENPMVDVHQVGLTYEKRDIRMATVSTKNSTKKPIIFLDCLIHSGEWVTTTTCLWILDQLTTKYGKDPDVTKLLDNFDWYIKPVANPDGYVYTWTTNRFWRKNRAPNQGSSCVGVDLNRNFKVAFIESDTVNSNAVDPCAGTFKGFAAFSERETTATRDVMIKYRDRIKMALFIHSYSQLWMSPYGVNNTAPPHFDQMDRLMTRAAAAIEAVHGTKYITGSIASLLYPASSTAVDYAYDVLGIIHSYTLELPDRGESNFAVPVSNIVAIAEETWAGIKEAAYVVLEELQNK